MATTVGCHHNRDLSPLPVRHRLAVAFAQPIFGMREDVSGRLARAALLCTMSARRSFRGDPDKAG